MRPFVPLAEQLGALVAGLAGGGVRTVVASYLGRIAEHDTRVLTLATLKGILDRVGERAGLVRERADARARPGLAVSEMRSTVTQDYVSSISVRAETDEGAGRAWPGRSWRRTRERVIAGLRLRRRDRRPREHMVFFLYEDRPGIIGKVGTILGEHGDQHRHDGGGA